ECIRWRLARWWYWRVGRGKVAAGWYGSLSLKSVSGSLISAKCRLRRLRVYQPSSSPANWNVGRRSVRRHPAGSATSSQPCSYPNPPIVVGGALVSAWLSPPRVAVKAENRIICSHQQRTIIAPFRLFCERGVALLFASIHGHRFLPWRATRVRRHLLRFRPGASRTEPRPAQSTGRYP